MDSIRINIRSHPASPPPHSSEPRNAKRKKWFNNECRRARNLYHTTRKTYNRHKNTHNKEQLKHVSKAYKQVISKNVRKHNSENIAKLKKMKHAKPRDFWKIINSATKTNKKNAPLDDLFQYFKNLNTIQIDENAETQTSNTSDTTPDTTPIFNYYINQPIAEKEIQEAIKNLKNNKSHGIDKILSEHLKTTINVMSPIYVKLFNIIYDTGIVPDSWTQGSIFPIYKNKGSENLPENYRPITLLSCFGKLFTSILNNRLNKYIEECDIIDSSQAGFRKGFSTTDNLFILQSLIEICKANKSKLFCAFIDFKQAFDTVWRAGLWQKLLENNVNGKFHNFIRNLYSNLKSRISTSEGTTAFFPCQIGVGQGEILSPMLFSIYLYDLKSFLVRNQVPGIKCEVNEEDVYIYIKLLVLLFADDTIIFGNNKEDLQLALDVFEKYCTEWKLTVNISKTKIVVFSGGRLPKNLKFFFKGSELEIVKEYKYLGVFLGRSGSFTRAKKHIADQANIAVFSLLRKIRILNLPLELQFDLFNKVIKPILLYGCEIWGFGNIDTIERVQLKFYKHILNLKKSTPSFMVYGELGAYPLKIDIQSRIISYWAKLNIDRTNDTAAIVYDAIYSLNEQGKIKSKWLENVKTLICSNGYSNIWDNQSNFNLNWFTKSFKQKVKDQYLQTWNALVDQSSSALNYRTFKTTFEMNSYFQYLPNDKCRILTAFRTRNHRLPIETGRWTSIPLIERTCKLCNNTIGDEFHYILQCDYLKTHRNYYIKSYYTRYPNTLKFQSLMNEQNKSAIHKLCRFIEVIMKTVRNWPPVEH